MIDCSESIVALICEGNSEKNYLNILLDDNRLTIQRSDLLTNDILPMECKKADVFQRRFLTMDYNKPLVLFLVQDNDKMMKKIRAPYGEKIKATYFFLTTPEIEMLLICHFNLYNEFQKVKSTQKPSAFLAKSLKKKVSFIKSKEFIENTFTNSQDLVNAIKEYSSKSPKREKKNHLELVELLK